MTAENQGMSLRFLGGLREALNRHNAAGHRPRRGLPAFSWLTRPLPVLSPFERVYAGAMDVVMLRGFLVVMMLGMAVATVAVFCQIDRTPVVGLLVAACWGLVVAAYLLATRGPR